LTNLLDRRLQQAGGARVDWNSAEAETGELDWDPENLALTGSSKNEALCDWGWAHWAEIFAPQQSWLQQLLSRTTNCPGSKDRESWQ